MGAIRLKSCLLFALWFSHSTAFADSFKCKTGQYIKTGMSTSQVTKLCGAPDSKLKTLPDNLIHQLTNQKSAKVWLYLPARNKFQQYLIIRHNQVEQIIRGNRIK
ncbi:DUF2845 domain-containing protein [Catenovulum sp. 2E275]|uniref:DUF2845 domain-containing protein n=1 Tax=Catenovulum sp. 2E275 TaxID=2980497 RepID=UPI0021CF5322|nr:DUF2845 domain-containing protein [Catenovulum sp. 2E275]MCU4674662.1 DUF2845 domain-containing protein [Catenovulum sp. 2E275]